MKPVYRTLSPKRLLAVFEAGALPRLLVVGVPSDKGLVWYLRLPDDIAKALGLEDEPSEASIIGVEHATRPGNPDEGSGGSLQELRLGAEARQRVLGLEPSEALSSGLSLVFADMV